MSALLLLLGIGSNIQAFPSGTLVTSHIEALLLTLSILFVALGTAQFGLSVVVTTVPIKTGQVGFWKLYCRAIQKTIENFRR